MPDPTAPERLIDPDCRDGKHGSCVGGPCECMCHGRLPVAERTPPDDTTPRGQAMTTTIPQQLEEADWKHTYNGIPVWELGEDGDLLMTTGHIDTEAFAKACDAYAREIWNYSLADAVDDGLAQIAGDSTHETARIVDPAEFPYFDFEVKFGEGDLSVTVWRAC